MAGVTLKHVSKVFPDGTVALSEMDLEVADGELLVIVGPSGCGKSTLLRIVAGLEDVTTGEIWLGDRIVNDVPPQQRNVAMVFQDYALYPFLTVEENLAFPLRMRKLPRAEQRERIARVARMLDIELLLQKYPRELSGGQRQRVAMGRALVREPAVSLLDEPLSNLDAKLRVSVRAEIAAIQERTRTTMIYVTHDQTEAMTLGHRVAVLDRGRLQQIAPPRVLYEEPVNAFVAGFIGNPPMNLFPAAVESRNGQTWLRVQGVRLLVDSRRLPRSVVGPSPAVIAGVRAEAIECSTTGGPGLEPATVEHVEHLGHESLMYIRLQAAASVRWVVRMPGMQQLRKNSTVFVRVSPERWYVFAEALPGDYRRPAAAQRSSADQ